MHKHIFLILSFLPLTFDAFAAKDDSNKRIFEELKKSYALGERQKTSEKFFLFHLFCRMEQGKVDTHASCEAYKSFIKTKKNKINFGKARSESLFEALSGTALIKGEGGISAEFLSCEKNIVGQDAYYSCMASMPIGVEK